jgi:hypothetical protein
MCPCFADWPSGIFGASQSGPRGRGRRQSGEIPARCRRSPAGEGRGRVFNSRGLGFGSWLAFGGGWCTAHQQPAAATAAGRAAARLALAGWQGRDKGRRGGGTRAQREDRPPFKQPSRTRQQRTDRWSSGCGRPRYDGGTSRRIGTSVAWGKREPRDGTRTAGRRLALARAYGGAPRSAARSVVLWSARARPVPTRAKPICSSLF